MNVYYRYWLSMMAINNNFKNLFSTKYTLKKVINCGMYGTVYKGSSNLSSLEFAVKKLPVSRHDMTDVDNYEMIRREIKHMRKLKYSKYTVKLYDICRDEDGNFLLVEELCNGISLDHVLSYMNHDISETTAGRIIYDILVALHDCHRSSILFTDLKPSNILFSKKDKVFKITDFGASLEFPKSGNIFPQKLLMTPLFAPPEVITKTCISDGLSRSMDIWSLGILAYWLILKQHPFIEDDYHVSSHANIAQKITETKPKFDCYPASDLALSFIKLCLQKDPNNRPNCCELLNHPFIVKCKNEKLEFKTL